MYCLPLWRRFSWILFWFMIPALFFAKYSKIIFTTHFNVFRSYHINTIHFHSYNHNSNTCHLVPEYYLNLMNVLSLAFSQNHIWLEKFFIPTPIPILSLKLLVNILVIHKWRIRNTLNAVFYLTIFFFNLKWFSVGGAGCENQQLCWCTELTWCGAENEKYISFQWVVFVEGKWVAREILVMRDSGGGRYW